MSEKKMMKTSIPEEEYMFPGTVDCQGCGAAYAMRLALKALGPETMVVIPACCWSIIAGPFPTSALKMPIYHTAFETAAAVASGIKAGLEIKGKKTPLWFPLPCSMLWSMNTRRSRNPPVSHAVEKRS